MRKIFHVFCGIAAGLLAAPVSAQESATDSGLYIGFGVGGSDGSFVNHSFTQFSSATSLLEDFRTDYSLAGIASIGHQWAPADSPGGFRLELEGSYRRAPVIIYANSLGTEEVADGHLETIGIMANGFVDFNFGESLTPYVGVGFGGVRATRRDLTINGVPFPGKFSHSTAWQIMTGVGYKLSPGTIIGLDFRHLEVQEFGWPDAPLTNVQLEFNEILLTLRLVG